MKVPKPRIAVGLSGGLDSTVAAYLLHRQGWEVVGFTLKFLPDENRCCDHEGIARAKKLCARLAVPHYVFDVTKEFERRVIDYFVRSYLCGSTPNPCAVCNREIRFGWFLRKAESLGAEFLATGHYARVAPVGGGLTFARGKDRKKSQEYFLAMIDPATLDRLVFPLGDTTKKEAAELAEREGLLFARRPESQDICFTGEEGYPGFLEERLGGRLPPPGPIRDLRGNYLGEHRGIHRYTPGQRRGLGVSAARPLYVIKIEAATNTVFLGDREETLKSGFGVSSLNWFYPPGDYHGVAVKIRRESPLLPCSLTRDGDGGFCRLHRKVSAPAPGQLAVFYDGEKVIAGGWIDEAGKI